MKLTNEMGAGFAFGILLGFLFGLAMNNFPVGLLFGVVFGIGPGAAFEKMKKRS
jgi:F0F1-type ATP synthase assembly protein I